MFDGAFQNVGDGVALVLYGKRLDVVAALAADVASDINIGQEVHFDPLETVALAGFAAAALHVEAESAGLVTALTRFRKQREKVADRAESAGSCADRFAP